MHFDEFSVSPFVVNAVWCVLGGRERVCEERTRRRQACRVLVYLALSPACVRSGSSSVEAAVIAAHLRRLGSRGERDPPRFLALLFAPCLSSFRRKLQSLSHLQARSLALSRLAADQDAVTCAPVTPVSPSLSLPSFLL